MTNLFLFSGRLSGDDDDTCRIVEADDMGAAQTRFENLLRDEADAAEDAVVYIVSSETLSQALAERAGCQGDVVVMNSTRMAHFAQHIADFCCYHTAKPNGKHPNHERIAEVAQDYLRQPGITANIDR